LALSIGSSSTCDVTIEGENVSACHAEILHRGHRVYCRALVGDAGDFSSKSYTWLEDTELRCGVDYMLSPGSKLYFGEAGNNMVRVEFDEGAEGGGMAQMMMSAMAQGANEEIRDRMSQ
jgi:hypothetical protein